LVVQGSITNGAKTAYHDGGEDSSRLWAQMISESDALLRVQSTWVPLHTLLELEDKKLPHEVWFWIMRMIRMHLSYEVANL